MRIDEDDLKGFQVLNLAVRAQPEHMLGKLGFPFNARTGLSGHERLEAFPSEAGQNLAGGDVGVPVRPGFVFAGCEDAGGHPEKLLISERCFRPETE
jgi:hypothetical protein